MLPYSGACIRGVSNAREEVRDELAVRAALQRQSMQESYAANWSASLPVHPSKDDCRKSALAER